jgi:hypothetical protein
MGRQSVSVNWFMEPSVAPQVDLSGGRGLMLPMSHPKNASDGQQYKDYPLGSVIVAVANVAVALTFSSWNPPKWLTIGTYLFVYVLTARYFIETFRRRLMAVPLCALTIYVGLCIAEEIDRASLPSRLSWFIASWAAPVKAVTALLFAAWILSDLVRGWHARKSSD